MGIYDRDYVREEGSGYLGSWSERGHAVKWLIGINVVAFILQLATSRPGHLVGPFTAALWLDVDDVLHGQVWRLLSYAFLHNPDNPFHILFNMLFLWWFGRDMEDLYGTREFVTFYLVAAVLSGVTFAAGALLSPALGGVCLGASGAVTAVLLLCACHYPSRTILLFFLLPVPIWIFVIYSVGRDLLTVLHPERSDTAALAHLGGALFGYAYYRFNWRLLGWWAGLPRWRRQRSQPRLRVYREEEPDVPSPVSVAMSTQHEEEQLEAKVDAVLEKISRVGAENLTEGEREVLLKASEIFRRRRH